MIHRRHRACAAAAFAAFLLLAFPLHAHEAAAQQPRPLLHPVFADHAVLQRDRPIAVWGRAAPGEQVTVALADTRTRTRAGASGLWRATLPARRAGGPFTLSVHAAGGASQSVSDVLVGDVYLCSGQSNMEFPARSAVGGAGPGSEGIRLLMIPRAHALAPSEDFAAPLRWRPAQDEALGEFSAVCAFFAREIEASARAPIGLIQSAWGGTRIESWMSAEGLRRAGGFDLGLNALAEAIADPAGARARYRETLAAWIAQHDPGARAGWAGADVDESEWAPIALSGGSWEASGAAPLVQFDGLAWLRTTFTLSPEQAAQSAELSLGPIDDIDVAYLNGAVVGGESNWQTPRVYPIPAGTLRAGRNTLAVAVLDTGGGGGLWGAPDTRVLRFADGAALPLSPAWRYRISAGLWDLPAPPARAPWDGQETHTGIYNAMIAPLAPYGLRGVLWYQGESNVAAPEDYARLLPAMMRDWRNRFNAPDLAFLIVQLANYGPPSATTQRHSWGALRDVQRRVAAADPHAGMAVSIDVGDRFDIHPAQKLVVAQRLARIARRLIYGETIEDRGPVPISARRAGDHVFVEFAHGPLVAYSAARPTAFELCDGDRNCRFVDATIDSSRIALDARGAAPAFVRYCWGDAPYCNLYNREDLPAAPFETPVAP